MHINVFTQCSPSPQFAGLWRHPDDQTSTGYRSIDHWTRLARRLERACIDALFFADTQGVFDVYRGSWAPAVRHAVQVPAIDPTLVCIAGASVTSHLGFAVTSSTTCRPPYDCARVFSSLDHLTGGRIAWNMVTSFLSSASANGLGASMPHDLRYDRADEYLTVVRGLWERSWADDAVVRDPSLNVFTDPDKVHEIGHRGRWFEVRGPHQCEPSPQRTPVLYQAGSSDRGLDFAARHAEVVFAMAPSPKAAAEIVRDLRSRADRYGRRPGAIKVLQGALVLLGRSREEANAKAKLVAALITAEGEFAKWSGWAGFDLAGYPEDAAVADIHTEASRSVILLLRQVDPNRNWTVADLRTFVSLGFRPRRQNAFVGTPETVADDMEAWLDAGIDGFNVLPCPTSAGLDDLCDLLVPELQRRDLFRTRYDPGETTLRERYFGAGRRHYDA